MTLAPMRFTPPGLPVLLLLVLSAGCVAVHVADQEAERARVILHTSYVTGGDGPLTQSLIFFEDGLVRLRTIDGRPRWHRLSPTDLAVMMQLTQSDRVRQAVVALPHSFACCDAAEVAISLGKTTSRLDWVQDPPTVELRDLKSAPEPVLRLLAERDRIGTSYFGRAYWTVLPASKN
jgi:hypothetical protein